MKYLYALWYLISWVGFLQANLIVFICWQSPTKALLYLILSGLILSWVHEHTLDNIHGSASKSREEDERS